MNRSITMVRSARPAPHDVRDRRVPLDTRLPYAGLMLSVAFAAAVAVPAPTALRLPLVLAFACLAPGAALVGHARIAEPALRWAMAVLLSLATTVAVACGAIWLHAWHPVPVALGTAAVAALSCAAALVRARAVPAPEAAPAARRPVRWRLTLADAGVLGGALALWGYAVAHTDAAGVGQFGLLAGIHPAFFAALLLCCAGFVAEIVRGARRIGALAGYTVVLILLLHATAPLLLPEPEYAWTFKHVGVIDLFQQYGRVLDSGDLYQRWPGVFAATAQISELSGVSALSLARFAPVLFNLLDVVVLLAIARTLTTDRRVAALTVFLFVCANWIEEDYLSPQALAHVLALGVILVALRWLRSPGKPAPTNRLLSWLRAGEPGAPAAVSTAGTAAALGALVLLDFALTATHQLSPYLVAAQVVPLVLLGLVRPRWTALVVVAVPVLFLVPRYGLVSGSFDIFESLDVFGNASGNADGWGTTGQAFSAIVVRLLALGVWAAAAVVVYRAARRGRAGAVLITTVLAAAPFVLLFAQSYGGEAIYRVYLFSAPWCALLIAGAAVRLGARWAGGRHRLDRHVPPRRRAVPVLVGGVVLAMLALATLQGRQGQFMVNRQDPAEVAAAEYLYAHAEPGSVIALAAPNFPSRLTAEYREFNRSVPVGEPDLVQGAGLKHVWLNDAYLPKIDEFVRSFGGDGTSYLVVSDGMRRYAEYFGHLPDGSLDALDRTLATAPGWTLFYRAGGVSIYQTAGATNPSS
ncbi:hypothetical protein RB614_14770 [Phytohabitans sp. ZYX-F-186]|uniref:Glycosyltransferase RgtA/B/C/D-like domain-containing protein n=1 Tax=Phytohabitans maris TaxID=3071409 RepID=A0ABU0ZHL6_9ACTN|nr:hypothetical protein [Phytohabitans sp. ZYX-F-186]MDQ7905780.1 hypothetical protein [Phytohabitans sp. ZYX-F-186]